MSQWTHRKVRKALQSTMGHRTVGNRVAIRIRMDDAPPKEKRVVYDLVIQLGCGKNRAKVIRAKVEVALRKILAELEEPAPAPSSESPAFDSLAPLEERE